MDRLSRFLQRNAHRFDRSGSLLVINPPADLDGDALKPEQRDLTLFSQDFAVCRALEARQFRVGFGTFPQVREGGWRDIVLSLPREKALLMAWLHWCSGAMAAGGSVWLAGEIRAGIKSALPVLQSYFGVADKQDSARHCVLIEAREPLPGPSFHADEIYQRWGYSCGGKELSMCSSPGVFAHGRLDPGSQMLLDHLWQCDLSGSALDFGCGAGVLSVALAARNPALELSLLDNHALALASSQRSLALNNFEAEVFPSDGLSAVTQSYDNIFSNPPFHQGIVTKSGMSMAMLHGVVNFLNPGGQLTIVVNRHLPYRRWLDEQFGHHEVMVADNRYQVLQARRYD